MTMKKATRAICLLPLLVACASTPTSAPTTGAGPEPAAEPTAEPTAEPVMAQKPDETKLTSHLNDHIKYPASREEVLSACASTPEFSEGEKQWVSENLAGENFENAEAVAAALP
jgi:hypothetical protein